MCRRYHRAIRRGVAASVALLSLFVLAAAPVHAAPPTPDLGSAAAFAAVAATTITNTGPTSVTGDLGVWPGTAVVGFPPGVVDGTIHANDGPMS